MLRKKHHDSFQLSPYRSKKGGAWNKKAMNTPHALHTHAPSPSGWWKARPPGHRGTPSAVPARRGAVPARLRIRLIARVFRLLRQPKKRFGRDPVRSTVVRGVKAFTGAGRKWSLGGKGATSFRMTQEERERMTKNIPKATTQ